MPTCPLCSAELDHDHAGVDWLRCRECRSLYRLVDGLLEGPLPEPEEDPCPTTVPSSSTP